VTAYRTVRTYQIWGSFTKEDVDREFPTTVSMFKRDQLMGDGKTRMVDWERDFAVLEGEDLVLLKEFEVVPDVLLDEPAEAAIARQIFDTYMEGWWHNMEMMHDCSTDELRPTKAPRDL
jgi:hypothetical protein